MNRRETLKAIGNQAIVLSLATFLASWRTSDVSGSSHTENSLQSKRPILQRKIPKTGELIPAVGLGSFETFDVDLGSSLDRVVAVIEIFFKHGGRVIDTSPLYGTAELAIGHALSRLSIRDEVFISNKVWATGKYLGDQSIGTEQVETSMQRLWRNHQELLHIHSLVDTPTKLQLLRQMKQEDKIKYIGVAHWLQESYDDLANVIQAQNDIDFLQVNYSIASRTVEDRLLPMALDKGIAVMTNMPFEKARLFELVKDVPLPSFAKELGCDSWGVYFLKFVLSNPAVTCALLGTSDPVHMKENIQALQGELPDGAMRKEMIRHIEGLPGYGNILKTPPYPGKAYKGVVAFPPKAAE